MKHIQVVGGPGSGKSTFSKKIAKKYGLRIIELDALYWKPNWKESTTEEFLTKIEKEMKSSKSGWIIDGSYTGKIGKYIQPKLDTLIYLQIPPYITIPRALRRSIIRIFKHELLWGTNKETVIDSLKLAWWTMRSYKSRVQRMHEIYENNPNFKMYIFKTNNEANIWLENL